MNESRDTRAALITSATRVFAKRGYRGASIKAITVDAKANLGAVTYHFGSKEHLYHEVIRGLLGPLLDSVRTASTADAPAMARLEAGVRAYFRYMHAHTELPAIMLQEMSTTGPLPPPIREFVPALIGLFGGIVREGQAEGEFVEGNPLLLTISTVAQAMFFIIMRRPLKEIAGINMQDRQTQDQMLDHLLSFSRRALLRDGGISR